MSELVELRGLSLAAAQVWKGVRIVPVLRDAPILDLRLDPICYADRLGVVTLPDRTTYTAFVPHAFVASWSKTDGPVAALGTQLSDGRKPKAGFAVHHHHRLAKRVGDRRDDTQRLRFLPLHLAFEGYLGLHFGGPDVVWSGYSRAALSEGLSPRTEWVVSAEWIDDLEDALRVFEILDGQVGVLLFIADALASAFVVPHPQDYRRLHRSLLGDAFGELIYRYSCTVKQLAPMASPIPAERVSSIADLERELARMRANWTEFLHGMAGGLVMRPVNLERIYRLGPHTLYRFLPDFSIDEENHIGELIRAPTGELAYLKTFRLTAAQVRRGYLLETLARNHWNLEATAKALGGSVQALRSRLISAGFDALLRP